MTTHDAQTPAEIDPTLSHLTGDEKKLLTRLSLETGIDPAAIAKEMVSAYLRLLLDAPAALPGRPLTGLVQRVKAQGHG
ncbi:MAG: hypothetical protein AAGK03_03495 [Pseudomonadota bacterium]